MVGEPVTFNGSVYRYYDTNEDRTQLYVVTKVTNADGASSYVFHIVPIGSSVAAQA